jgi:hypothetical protein
MPESYRTGSSIEIKPLWQIYYPDRDLSSRYAFHKNLIFLKKIISLVKGKSSQHDTSKQNGTISKEKSTDDIEVIMLSKQVIKQRRSLSFELVPVCLVNNKT